MLVQRLVSFPASHRKITNYKNFYVQTYTGVFFSVTNKFTDSLKYTLTCGNKMLTRCNRWIFIADLIACSTCFGAPLCLSSGAREYYTSGCCLSYLVLGFQVVGMVWSWGLCVRFAGNNKICNKNSSVAFSYHFISTYYRRCAVKTTSNTLTCFFLPISKLQ